MTAAVQLVDVEARRIRFFVAPPLLSNDPRHPKSTCPILGVDSVHHDPTPCWPDDLGCRALLYKEPERDEFPDTVDGDLAYLHAHSALAGMRANLAQLAFPKAFRRALRRSESGQQ